MAPPLPSRPMGIPLIGTQSPHAVVELFLDLSCPFSRKMYNTLDGDVFSQVKADEKLAGKVKFIFHNVPQPWHPQSPVMHESMMAFALACDHDPKMLSAFARSVFSAWPKFADKYTADKSRTDIHAMCIDIAAQNLGDKLGGADAIRGKMASFLNFSHLSDDEPNNGLGEATKLLKFAIKHHRVRGVHVTPTVFVNSIEAPDISSSWNADKWMEKLKAISEN